jgi:predicted nucleotidyltransferase
MILKNKHKEILLDIFNNTLSNSFNILAFGSRVNGDATNGSDLDLVVKTTDNSNLNIDEFYKVKNKLKDSNIPFLVDVLDWQVIPDYFKDNILKNYEVLK